MRPEAQEIACMIALLVLDTATPATVVGLRGPDGDLVELRHDPAPGERPGHVAELPRLVLRACREAGVALGGNSAGSAPAPGPVRSPMQIGARDGSLARPGDRCPAGAGADVGGARGAAHAHASTVVAVLDARRGEAFAAVYRDSVAVAARSPPVRASWRGPSRRSTSRSRSVPARSSFARGSRRRAPASPRTVRRCTGSGRRPLRARGAWRDDRLSTRARPEYVRAPDAKPRSATGSVA